MPISYTFDKNRGLIITKVSGELNISITQDYFERLAKDKNCPGEAIEIVDFSGVTDFSIRYGEMRKITEAYQNTKSTRNIRSTIFNCTSDLSYGIARMLKTLHEIANEKHIVTITRSPEELIESIKELRSDQPDA